MSSALGPKPATVFYLYILVFHYFSPKADICYLFFFFSIHLYLSLPSPFSYVTFNSNVYTVYTSTNANLEP